MCVHKNVITKDLYFKDIVSRHVKFNIIYYFLTVRFSDIVKDESGCLLYSPG